MSIGENFKGLKGKLLVVFLLMSLIPLIVVSLVSYMTSQGSLKRQAMNHLISVREMKKSEIEEYFDTIRKQAHVLSKNRMIIDAMKEFKGAFHGLKEELRLTDEDLARQEEELRGYYDGEYLPRLNKNLESPESMDKYWPSDEASIILQYLYISSNPNQIGQKDNLDAATDGSTYSKLHQKHHPIIRHFLEEFGYYDIFLVDEETGHLVYTVYKETDFATSLLTGPYKDTNFARAFRAARDAPDKDFVKLVDFEPYDPSYHLPASFIASPIYDGVQKVGVLIVQMPVEKINDIMTFRKKWEEVGLGKGGKSYLVGQDYKMRNDSRFLADELDERIRKMGTTILIKEVHTEGIEDALKGNSDTRVFPDYRGVSVLSAYSPLKIEDVHWVIMSEIDEAEAFGPVNALKNFMLVIAGIATIAVVVLSIRIARSITNPIAKLRDATIRVGKGDLDTQIEVTSSDEVGELATSFKKMTEALQKTTVSKDYVDNIIKTITDTLIVVTSEDTIKTVNQATLDLLGYEENELVGKSIRIIFAEEEEELLFKKSGIKDLMKKESVRNVEKTYLSKDGRKIPVLFSGSVMRDVDGKIQGIVCVMRDITERRNAEEELQKTTAQLFQTSKLATLGEMSAGLAHELNQPLTGISLASANMRKLMEKGLLTEEEIKEVIGDIDINIRRMSNVITHIRTFARQDTLKFHQMGVNNSVENALKLLGEQLRLHEIETVKELAHDLPTIMGEPYQIEQVIINLISNARDTLDEKGKGNAERLKGWSKKLKIGTSLKGDWVCIDISDNGVGMSEEIRQKMFNPFYTTKEVGKATGLGMSISYGIIQNHKGRIEVKSEEGKGTKVSVKLPIGMEESYEG